MYAAVPSSCGKPCVLTIIPQKQSFHHCTSEVILSTSRLFLELTKRDVPGFAIGGLSGGEEKGQFWRMVTLSTDHLPRQKPRYLMGVGCVLSVVVCTVFSMIAVEWMA